MGNNTSVSIGTQKLIDNSYEPRSGLLLNSTYGNNQKVSNTYDNLNRIASRSNNGVDPSFNYSYDASGNLGYKEDIENKTNYRYIYDLSDRLNMVNDSKGNSLSYNYDLNNNIYKITDNIGSKSYATSYNYDSDNKPLSVVYTRDIGNNINFQYDKIARLEYKTINTDVASYTIDYKYKQGVNGSSTNKVESISNNGNIISYTYDPNGNIETIAQGGKQIKYQYNELNELVREDNQVLNKTIAYSYDAGGNILNKTEYGYTSGALGQAVKVYNYAYGDTIWKDKLTSYDGNSITYDNIGNPLSYKGYNYTWKAGRQLSAISGNGIDASYKYNDSGIRTEKTLNGVTTKYHLIGDKVAYEDNGTNKLYYTYDSSGKLQSMSVLGGSNLLAGISDVGAFENAIQKSGVDIVDTVNPETNATVRALRLNKSASVPNIWTPQIALKTNTNYALEFDYWADDDNVKFDVDMYPDDLPQSYPVAGKTVQHYRWEFSSPSSSMNATNIRIFNDTASVNPSNIFVTNIKLSEINKTSDNILGSTTPVGMFAAGSLSGASIVDATNPQTQTQIKAVRLNSGVNAPVAWSPQMSLKTNTDYTIEFDYWADADNVAFDADFFPDDLPEVHPVAKTKLQHYKWNINSSSDHMKATNLRFFNDRSQTNPANIYITNIKLYESSKVNEASKEYYYVRNAQGDIIGLADEYGNDVVSYLYDSYGKLVSITGKMAGSVGVVNPYRYRGYRYDNETGLYYLQSRYYNPEWGRFINADGIIGQTGELLAHNLFAYSMNNPVNMSDNSGFRPTFDSEEQQAQYDDWAWSQVPTSSNPVASKSSFDYLGSAIKGGKSGAIDEIGEITGGTLARESKKWIGYETLTMGKYTIQKSQAQKTLGIAGTVGFTLWDVGNDLYNGLYFGAGVDVASSFAGFLFGYALEAGGEKLTSKFGVRENIVTKGSMVVGIGAGVGIDYISDKIKNWWYGR